MTDYYDLGSHSRAVTTSSHQTQAWFDRGLVWCYAFNHEEAIRCFQTAVEHDPDCAMAHWGIAHASGPNYNKPWSDFTDRELAETLVTARGATDAALARTAGAAPVEQALIRALDVRYQSGRTPGQGELGRWNDAYADAMRVVHTKFSDDLDVVALFAEAMMNRTPWQLWDLVTGEHVPGADTREIVAVLEGAQRLTDMNGHGPHPGILHMYIHAMEMSPRPERALRAADALRDLAPDAGHLRHMPSHIDILCGDYHTALVSNERAIEADRKYLEREGPFNAYTLSRCHDYHFKAYAAMFLGQCRPALDAADEMVTTVPRALLQQATPPMADWLEGFMPLRAHVLVRFGRWQALVDEPVPDDPYLYLVTTAVMHYAKGVAHASLGQIVEAEAHQHLFDVALARVPTTRMFFNNRCVDILAIAAEMLQGEVHYRRGDHERGFARLRTAVALYDSLPYDEPWGWMQPPRHALGALLLEQGHVDEAEDVYRSDLGQNPKHGRASGHADNVWSLHGLVECLQRTGNQDEAAAMQPRLDIALARADPEITSSCLCRLGDG